MKDTNKVVLKGGYVPQKMSKEELEKYLQEVKRGAGAHKSKKDYNRKDKKYRNY